MSIISMKQLLEAGVHFGHQTRKWNPKMKKYIFTDRNKVHIINLEDTSKQIDKAYYFVKDAVNAGAKVLFVGTKKQVKDAVMEEATRCGMFYVNSRWLGGTLTNFKTIRSRVERMIKLENMEKSGEFDLLPKNVINYLGKVTRDEFEKLVGPALDDEEGFIVYKVKNKYDEVVTALRCYYRESDSKLISIKFPTPHYLGYWIDFTTIEGYPKTQAVAKKNGNYLPKRDQFNRLYQINLKTKSFGCQIMDIKEYSNYSTAVINYHIVK